MPDQRHRTTIEIAVDDRQIRGLDRTMHRAFDDQMLSGFERVLERNARLMESMVKSADRLQTAMSRTGGMMDGGGGGGRRGGGDELRAAMMQLTQSVRQLNRMQEQAGRRAAVGSGIGSYAGSYLGGLAARGTGQGLVAQALGGIPLIGGLLGGALGQAQQFYGQYASQEQARSRTYGGLGRASLPGGVGFTRFGLDRAQAFQTAQGFAGQAGLSGEGVTPEFLRAALQLQMLGGVGSAAGFAGAAGIGGGATTPQQMLEAVSAGLQAGIREARLDQFVAAATGVLEQSRLEGADMGVAGVLQTLRGLSGLGGGFRGEQAQRAVQSAVPSMRRFEPGMDVASLVGLRAVGFGTPGGPSFHEALRRFQEDPQSVLPQLIEQVRAMAPGNEGAQVELMRQIMPRFLGFTPTITQAESLARGDLSGFQEQVGPERAAEFLGGRARGAGAAGFGTAAAEAQYRNRAAGVGGRVAAPVRRIRGLEMDLTEQTLPRIMSGVDQIITRIQRLLDAFMEGGFTALLSELGDVVADAAARGVATAGRTILGIGGTPSEADERSGMAYRQREAAGIYDQLVEDPASIGRELYQGIQDMANDLSDSVRGGPATPVDLAGGEDPSASAAFHLRRAAEHLDRTGLAGDGALALG